MHYKFSYLGDSSTVLSSAYFFFTWYIHKRRPLSSFWVNAKHRRGGGEWLEMESFEMEQVWQKKRGWGGVGGQCFCVASCLSLKSAKPCWIPEPRIRAPVIIGWEASSGRALNAVGSATPRSPALGQHRGQLLCFGLRLRPQRSHAASGK